MARYNAKESEVHWQSVWEKADSFLTPNESPQTQMLHPRDVPLSVGAHPYGPCAQLHDG